METSVNLSSDADNYTLNGSHFISEVRLPNADAVVPFSGLDMLQYHVRNLDLYATPTLLAVGILANLIAGLLLAQPRMRKSPVSVYFLAIVVSNQVYLLTFLHNWLTQMGYSLNGAISWWCHFMTFSEKASDFLSLWYVVCLIADRCLHTVWPDRHADLCSAWRARLMVIGIAILSTVIFLNTSLTVELFYVQSPIMQIPMCRTLKRFQSVMQNLSNADIFINGIVGMGCTAALLARVLSQKAQELKEDMEFWWRSRRSKGHSASHRPAQNVSSNSSTVCEVIEEYDVTSGQSTAAVTFTVLFLLFHLPLEGYNMKQMFHSFVSTPKPSLYAFLIKKVLTFVRNISYTCALFVLIVCHSGLRWTVRHLCTSCTHCCSCKTPEVPITIELEGEKRSGHSKSSMDESSTVEFVSHESAYV